MTLTAKRVRLARVVAAIVLGDWRELRRQRAAAPPGEPDREWREAVLQTHLFAGFPRLVEAYEVLERAGGLGAPDRDEHRPLALGDQDGAALFERIYADQAAAVRGRLAGFHSDFAAWIADHAYGRVLSRPGLAPDCRELLAVAALAMQGQDRQLASHARGAVRCGARTEEVFEVLTAIEDLLPPGFADRGRSVLERFARE